MANKEFDKVKYLVLASVLIMSGSASAQSPKQDYQSCNIKAQESLKAEPGGSIKDPLQAHISTRANILQADIGSARKAKLIKQKRANALWQRVEKVRKEADGFVTKQGFLSAAERASYDRDLNAVASKFCR